MFVALWLLLAAGCQSNQNVQVLSPEKFAATTSGTAYSTVDTNATTGTNAKPRVIVPGVSISVTVDQDHSLDHVYVVPISGSPVAIRFTLLPAHTISQTMRMQY